jgi:hypothetical protein
MSCKPNRRDLLISGAAIASSPADGAPFVADTAGAQTASTSREPSAASQTNPYMGAPVGLGTAPNGAITNKKLLDGLDKVAWLEPTIERPAEGVWVFGGYGLAPMSIIDTDEGLIAFDTSDTKHYGELMFEALRTVTDKPVKAIIYGHSHTCFAGRTSSPQGTLEQTLSGEPDPAWAMDIDQAIFRGSWE